MKSATVEQCQFLSAFKKRNPNYWRALPLLTEQFSIPLLCSRKNDVFLIVDKHISYLKSLAMPSNGSICSVVPLQLLPPGSGSGSGGGSGSGSGSGSG
jgi:hypothetical protein